MKAILSLVYCLIMPFTLAAAKAEQLTLTFSTHNYPPFSSIDQDNNPTGPFVDILSLACNELDYQCHFISVPNRRSKLMLENNQVQANFPMGWNTERDHQLYFSIPLMNMQYGFFYSNDSLKEPITSLADIQTLNVGVFGPSNASYQLEKLKQKMHSQGLKEFSITLITDANGTGVKMLDHKRIDAYFANNLQAKTHLAQFGLDNIQHAFTYSEHPYFVTFNKIQTSRLQLIQFNQTLYKLYVAHNQFKDILAKYNIETVSITPQLLMQYNIIHE
ncbi:transporter substrate-binding domain-containing protein [Pseudoalteromonas sp. MMG010]|uniref:substrate-binding periplasmic protein n=1 Tax=Pseudoalteromonas sp. MMG010 TaxID=2822685 RepID=UPI001B3A0973|nr:transporter substrate-binding domain-containing protein [Pseudoalteromonas sp. MMG010]MBQ4833322.1 transporter substrate-binding domain-containing protein [Pseudoalteromonas sp. MMG010]